MSARLPLAIETGGLVLPETGILSVLHPAGNMDLSPLPRERLELVQPNRPDFEHLKSLGYNCVPASDAPCEAALVCLPRAKALARALIATACQRSRGLVIVDGSKTDGIDSLLKECRNRADVAGPIAKAHGKLFWFRPDPLAFADWLGAPQKIGDFATVPGVFSADSVDPASHMLAAALPSNPGKRVIDLGAGWGYLTARVLRDPTITQVDLVEADALALDCARQNITDPRAHFHWKDALSWAPKELANAVIMNPPFHIGRTADPSLGRAFVVAAARMLAPSGHLWMVANRHLAYERTLHDCFARVEETGGDGRFKIFHAIRPKAPAKSTPARTRR